MERQYDAIVTFTTVKATLKKADAILFLAKEHSEHAGTLAACAVILLAAAMEQGISTVLSDAALTTANEEDIHVWKTAPGKLGEDSLCNKVLSLPNVLTNGRYEIVRQSRVVKDLYELIKLRNRLVHVNEPAIHLKNITIEETGIRVNVPLPQNPWDLVTISNVETFRTALDVYFREVLFPEGEIRSGEIVRASRK